AAPARTANMTRSRARRATNTSTRRATTDTTIMTAITAATMSHEVLSPARVADQIAAAAGTSRTSWPDPSSPDDPRPEEPCVRCLTDTELDRDLGCQIGEPLLTDAGHLTQLVNGGESAVRS